MIANDQPGSAVEIQAFDRGVDEFVRTPVVPQVFIARLRRLIKMNVTDALGSALKVQVGPKELPGILQYLDTEQKTGRLTIEGQSQTAILTIQDGRFVNAELGGKEAGEDIIVEILCWPSSTVTLVEEKIAAGDCRFDCALMSVLMNSVVEVDELNNIRQNLPSSDATFEAGNAAEEDLQDGKGQILRRALNGHSTEELLGDPGVNERQATIWLHELLADGLLTVCPAPFARYRKSALAFYEGGYNEIDRICDDVANHTGPIQVDIFVPPRQANWPKPVPRMLLVGDNSEHIVMLSESINWIYANVYLQEIPSQSIGPNATVQRFDVDEAAFEIVTMPSFRDKDFQVQLKTALKNPFLVVHVASAQDAATNKEAQRVHRLIRRHFRGVYCHLVPRVYTPDGSLVFKISCQHCKFKLAVDMDEAGFSGECPVCGESISVPNAIHHLANSLKLPSEVPIATVDPRDPDAVRDLLLLLLGSAAAFRDGKETSQLDDLTGDSQERETMISLADTQFVNVKDLGDLESITKEAEKAESATQ
jgi:hypothetical protein